MTQEVNAPAWQTTSSGAPAEFAGVTALGDLVRVFPAREGADRTYRPLAIIGGALVGIGVVIAIVIVVSGGPWAALQAAAVPCAIGAVLFALYAVTMRRVNGAARSVVVYEGGFATLVGAKVGVWPWTEIAAIVSTESTGTSNRGGRRWTTRSYALSTRGGETIVLNDDWFADVQTVSQFVKDRVFMVLQPDLQSAYASGAPVTFGPVTVSKEAIESEGRRLEWRDVRGVVVERGRLIATPKDGAPLEVRVSRIPNVEVLGALIGVKPESMKLAYW